MRTMLFLTAALAANASAAETTATPQAQPLAQPLAATPGIASIKAKAESQAAASPKIHEIVATRNADGTLEIGCAERPNPTAHKPPLNTISPEPQQ